MALLTACSQVNYIRNSFGRLLDLCFVTSPENRFLSREAPLTQPEDPYHPTFEVAIDIGTVVKVKSEKSTKRSGAPLRDRTNSCLLAQSFSIPGFKSWLEPW